MSGSELRVRFDQCGKICENSGQCMHLPSLIYAEFEGSTCNRGFRLRYIWWEDWVSSNESDLQHNSEKHREVYVKSFIKSEKKQPHMAIQTEIWTAGKGVYVCVCLSLSSLKSCISSSEGGKRVCVTLVSKKNCWTVLLPHQLGTDSSKGTNLETEQ